MSWQQDRHMTPERLRYLIATLSMDKAKASRFLGCSYRQMDRMVRGERAIPVPVALLLGCMVAKRVRPLVPKKVPGTY